MMFSGRWTLSSTCGRVSSLPVLVPGYVHSMLVSAGLIPDPYVGLNEKAVAWIDETGWVFRCAVDQVSETLCIPSLDGVARVFVDGKLVAEHANAFIPLILEVWGRSLEIHFEPAVKVGERLRAEWLAAQGLEDVGCLEPRSFVRIPQYRFGWDWGPTLVSCGFAEAPFWGEPTVEPAAEPWWRLVQEPDEFGVSFQFFQGDQPVWVRGANWIPSDVFDSSRDLRLLDQAAEVGVNMLRIWGGGRLESESFYRGCAERGIAIWQDFYYACAYYPDDGPSLERAYQEAVSIIRRLQHHPNIVLWCGNNEVQMLHEGRWAGARTPERLIGERIFTEVIPRALRDCGEGRPYIPGSPFSVRGESQDGGSGDKHEWDVWHGRGDWTYYRESKTRFASEFGFLSSCGMKCWEGTLSETERSPNSEEVQWHNKSNKPTYHDLIEIHYPRIETLEDLVYFSQLNQRDALREAIEHYRLSPECSGVLFWQWNDCWPVQSWSVVDFQGQKKAAGQEMRRLYAETLLSLLIEGGAAILRAHQLAPSSVHSLTLLHFSWQGHPTTLFQADQTIPPGIHELARVDLADEPGIIWAQWGEFSAWKLTHEPKDSPQQDPGVRWESGILTAERPAVDLWLGQEEFITLMPGQEFNWPQKPSEDKTRSLSGEHPILILPEGT